MKNIDWSRVEEAKGFEKLPMGGYVCGITAVEDKPDDEKLVFEFDIAEGEHKNTYRTLYEARNFWAGKFTKSYKKEAQGYFKSMLTAFEKSNKGFVFNNDEKTLKRKFIGLVIGYREYIGNDGTVKEGVDVQGYYSVDDIRSGNFKPPVLKKLKNDTPAQSTTDAFSAIEDDDLPFN